MQRFEILDRTMYATYVWLDDISEDLKTDQQGCYHALRAVLHALRDNVPMDDSAGMVAQMPILIRGIYFAEWTPTENASKDRSKKKFIARVEKNLQNTGQIDPEQACRAVFRTLDHHLGAGVVDDIRQSLAKPIQSLWPEAEEESSREGKESGKQEQDQKPAVNKAAAAKEKEDGESEDKDEEEQEQEQEESSNDSSERPSGTPLGASEKSAEAEDLPKESVQTPSAQHHSKSQGKEDNMQHYDHDDYGNEYENQGFNRNRNDRGASYGNNERDFDERRFSRGWSDQQDFEGFDEEHFGGRNHMNRSDYGDDYQRLAQNDGMHYGYDHYSGQQHTGQSGYDNYQNRNYQNYSDYNHDNNGSSGSYARSGSRSRYAGSEDYTAYPRDNNYQIRDYPSRSHTGHQGHGGRYASHERYGEGAGRHRNQGQSRYLAGNRQSYGYDDDRNSDDRYDRDDRWFD